MPVKPMFRVPRDERANISFTKIGPAGTYYRTSAVSDEQQVWSEKDRSEIYQIHIWHSEQGIHSIQFQYENSEDRLVMSEMHGTGNGTKFDVVQLREGQRVRIESISGRTSGGVLSSITFCTNNNVKHGPFGRKGSTGDQKFKFEVGMKNEFGGFFGANNKTNVTAIGFYLKNYGP